MAKLSVFTAFLLVALIGALGQASAKRTIVTTTIVEEEDGGDQVSAREWCQRQISMEKMRPCMTYLSNNMGQGMDERGEGNPMPRQLQMCCSELQRMDKQCRCDAIQMMMTRQQEKREFRGQQMQKMMQEAKQIPGKCNMRPQQCRFDMEYVQTY